MEVVVSLRFTTPCLGDQRTAKRDYMRRDVDGHVILIQAWWRSSLRYAAQALSRFHKEIEAIQADPVVLGETKLYKRYYSTTEYKEHEAFLDGDSIVVKFMLPNTLSIADFHELLSIAGRYVGISPYGFKQNFGRFVVVEVKPVRRALHGTGQNTQSGEHDSGVPRVRVSTESVVDIPASSAEGRITSGI